MRERSKIAVNCRLNWYLLVIRFILDSFIGRARTIPAQICDRLTSAYSRAILFSDSRYETVCIRVSFLNHAYWIFLIDVMLLYVFCAIHASKLVTFLPPRHDTIIIILLL